MVNELIGWMVRNFVSRKENVLKIYKTLKRILTGLQYLDMEIEMGGYKKKSDKNNKKESEITVTEIDWRN